MTITAALALALRLAWRELRGGLKGFRVMLACLALGVGAIAAVGSLGTAVDAALKGDARALLGGDVELTLPHRAASEGELAAFAAAGRVSTTVTLRAMARPAPAPATSETVAGDNGKRILVELKAVDAAYPLYGKLELAPALALSGALAQQEGAWGAVADSELLIRLGLHDGDRVKVGDALYQIRAVIAREPDRGGDAFILGPRLLVSDASLAATGLIQPGSVIHYHYRLALPPGSDARALLGELQKSFPESGWRGRSFDNAAPRLQQFLDRIALFLMLVGLTALLVGGVGMANAVKSYLDSRVGTIAIFKCLGAPSRLVFLIYLAETIGAALFGIALGAALGALLPWALGGTLSHYLPVVARVGFYPRPLALAAAFGLLTTLAFTLGPLAATRDIPPAQLFRALVAPARRWPRRADLVAMLAAAVALAALTILAAEDRRIALWFVGGAMLSLAIFRLAGFLIERLAASAARWRSLSRGRPVFRLAFANLSRPGAPTSSVVLSLGVGLTLLVAVGLVQGDLDREVTERLPEGAPAYYFIDIQPDELAAFDRAVEAIPGASGLAQVPSLRGRITRVAGIPIEEAIRQGRGSWALEGDRGLTYAATLPEGSRLTAGQWWPADYRGAPLVSLDAAVAKELKLGLGDTLTVNLLGREVTATIASLREVHWSSLSLNFVMLFSPGILEHAPQTYLATVKATPEAEEPILRAVTDRFPNITVIHVKDALAEVAELLGRIGSAIRLTAIFTLVAGILVLGSAVAAEHRRRVYDSVLLKVLGATRARLLATFLVEYGALGLAAALVAACIGSAAGYLLVTRVMEGDWRFLPGTVAGVVLASVAITLLFGFAGTWRALGQKPAAHLRNE